MINTVRNTVLSILSKDNRGYMTPEQFNMYANIVQLEIFEEYFYNFAQHQAKLFARMETTGSANISEQKQQIIDRFLTTKLLIYDGTVGRLRMPGIGGNGTNQAYPRPFRVERIYKNGYDVDIVPAADMDRIARLPNISPTSTRMIGSIDENGIRILPSSVITSVFMQYIRFPETPKWTYTMVAGNPLFNISAADYQDFELPESDMPLVVVKILQYAGVTIREQDVVENMKREESMDKQEKL